MNKFVAFNPMLHTQYVRTVLTMPISNATRGILSVNEAGVPEAVILFDGWTPNSACCHVAADKPMALRGLFKEGAIYLFDTCDKKMLIGIVASDHEKALKIDYHLGFREITRIKDCYDNGVDQIVLQLKREDCSERYLPKIPRLQEAA